jgi:hypothetical protein
VEGRPGRNSKKLEAQALVARGLALDLRQKHLDRQLNPSATSTLISLPRPSGKGRTGKLCLDVTQAAERGRVMGELSAGTQWRDTKRMGDPPRPSAPLMSPMDQDSSPEEPWPWFLGKMEDLGWFKRAWEDNARQFHPRSSKKFLIEQMHKYCLTISIGRVIEGARNLVEMWLLLETHFDRQTALVDGLLSQLLKTEPVVNDVQVLSYYDRVLQAIQKAEEVGRMQDLLTPNQIEVLLTLLPRKEANYWRIDHLNVAMEELPIAFYSFVRRRICELRFNTTSMRVTFEASPFQCRTGQGKPWKGPCLMGYLCGKNHMPESCSIFDKLSP